MASSLRFYHANAHSAVVARALFQQYPHAVGLGVFPYELWPQPVRYIEAKYAPLTVTQHDTGGHFAALEQPAALYASLQAFMDALGQ